MIAISGSVFFAFFENFGRAYFLGELIEVIVCLKHGVNAEIVCIVFDFNLV